MTDEALDLIRASLVKSIIAEWNHESVMCDKIEVAVRELATPAEHVNYTPKLAGKPPVYNENDGLHDPVERSGDNVNPIKDASPLFPLGFPFNLLRQP